MKLFLRALIAASVAAVPSVAMAGEALNIQVPTTASFTTNSDTGASSTQPSTIQYNASNGQSNNFAVGTNTTFGVNSSASSTPDYSVTTTANLGAGVASSLNNQIGSSGAASAASSFAEAASHSAESAMDIKVNAGWEAAYAVDHTLNEDQWKADYKSSGQYQVAYNDAYKSAYSSISGSSSNSNQASGTISGDFVSVTTGSAAANTGGSKSVVYVESTNADHTKTYREATAADFASNNLQFYTTDVDDEGHRKTASSNQVAQAASYAASSTATSITTNSVTVKGIGSDATFNASDVTKFTVGIASNLGKVDGNGTTANADGVVGGGTLILTPGDGKINSSATANGAANGNFGTNSTAASNSSTYTSVFYQAF